MTRKRFVKLLMAEGYSRNGANDIADDVLADGFTYAEAYDQLARLFPLMRAMADPLGDAFRKATETIGKMAAAVCEATKAFVDAFHAAMTET